MTTRPMSTAMEAALAGDIIYPIYFFEIENAGTTLRLWTGMGDFTWDGHTWSGVGWILGVSEVEETTETRATSFTIGTPATTALIAIVLQYFRKNKPVTIWQGLLGEGFAIGDPETGIALGDPATGLMLGNPQGALLEDPIVLAYGLTDIQEIDTDPQKPVIRISCETRIADLERARVRRFTHEDHQIDYPGDLFFQYVGSLSDKIMTWGNPSA